MPYVAARSVEDALAALGWLHANDRMFQMELQRRAGAGRLSELFGERALEFDKKVRRLRIRRSAARLVDSISAESRKGLAAYAAGVNAWIASRGADLPPEFRLLRARPEPWSPADSLSVVFLMARQLSAIFEPNEEELFVLLRAFGAEAARELEGDLDAPVFEEVARMAAETPSAGEEVEAVKEGSGLGSNNWAVAPSRTASRSALVANDPHLGLGLPGVWYQAAIRAPGYDVSGMTIPGVPGVVLGRSENLAWAFTNLYVDDVDLFLERVDASNSRVLRGTEWVPIHVESETIRVDGGDAVSLAVRSTDRGPLLEAEPEKGLPARSVAWTGYEPADQLLAFLNLSRAASVAEVPAAIASFVFPAQNLVVADRAGSLLWTPIGRGPNRFGWDGRFPAPAERADVGWSGSIPVSDNPSLTDPADGALVTANSFLPVELPAWFQGEFDTSYRAERIRELLLGKSDWTPAELVRLQSDTESLWARWLVPHLAGPHADDAERAFAALSGWNKRMDATGAAALFALVERELHRAIFQDEAEEARIARFGNRWRLVRLFDGRLSRNWFDDVRTPAFESRDEAVGEALAAAWTSGAARWGGDVSRWPYAGIHRLTLDHALGAIPVLGRWWNRGPFPVPGAAATVLAFGGPWRGDELDVEYGPSMRLVNDLGAADRGLSILPSGQSGHPGDSHYADQLPLYLAGEARSVPWSDGAIEAATVERLRLEPAGKS
jgi:penicillin amidase